jgi:ABC-type polysaccharide/polyol phosphate export permease
VTTVLFNLVQFVLALAVFFPMAWWFFQVPAAWSWLSFLPVVALHVLFTLGICFFVSTATVFYRDVRHFTEIFIMLIFWLTPIIYDVESAPPALKAVLYMNPLSYFILAYQDALYHNVFSSLGRWTTIASLALASLVLGCMIFAACKTRFAEEA